MTTPNLQMFREDTPSVEVGTLSNPIDFGICYGGQATSLPYQILLFNDKGAVTSADDARNITIELEQMEVTIDYESDGSPDQTFNLSLFPLSSVVIYVDDIRWTRVASLSTYSQNAEVYTCNLTTGEIIFGDNIHGKIPVNLSTISVSIIPDTNTYGKTVLSEGWISIASSGRIYNIVDVSSEIATKNSNSQITVAHFPAITSVVGVWDNSGKIGTNYYTGGSFDSNTGVITLGTDIEATLPYVEYSYTIKDEGITSYTRLITGGALELNNPIPYNNAKYLQLKATVPDTADTEGGVSIKIRLKVTYEY